MAKKNETAAPSENDGAAPTLKERLARASARREEAKADYDNAKARLQQAYLVEDDLIAKVAKEEPAAGSFDPIRHYLDSEQRKRDARAGAK